MFPLPFLLFGNPLKFNHFCSGSSSLICMKLIFLLFFMIITLNNLVHTIYTVHAVDVYEIIFNVVLFLQWNVVWRLLHLYLRYDINYLSIC